VDRGNASVVASLLQQQSAVLGRDPAGGPDAAGVAGGVDVRHVELVAGDRHPGARDRKSTRLNSSHVSISYAVFCLKKKTYALYDVLWLDGHSTMDLPYTDRRARLRDLELNGASWQTPPNEVGDGSATTEVSLRFGS